MSRPTFTTLQAYLIGTLTPPCTVYLMVEQARSPYLFAYYFGAALVVSLFVTFPLRAALSFVRGYREGRT